MASKSRTMKKSYSLVGTLGALETGVGLAGRDAMPTGAGEADWLDALKAGEFSDLSEGFSWGPSSPVKST